jgi:hypothetical protein
MSGWLTLGNLAGDAHDEYSRADWQISSRCNAHGACVEVARLAAGDIGVRDGKDQSGPVLRLTAAQWRGFVASLRAGQLSE